MAGKSTEVVICGAGILGISAAYALAQRGVKDIMIVDERPPLTLTSDKSSECYRNWWPGPGDAMVQLMNRSITLIEERAAACNNMFKLNRRGYLYVTTDRGQAAGLRAAAAEAASLGAGSLREHAAGSASYAPHHAEGFEGPDGADLLTDAALIHKHFPYLASETAAALHVRRAGWLSAQSYGMWMWEQARAAGVQLTTGRVASVETAGGAVSGVSLADGTQIRASTFINAAGPHLGQVSSLLGLDIPVYNELHLKAAFNDHLAAVGRDAPLVICADEQELPWSEDERAMLAEDAETAWLLDRLPSGAHTRPEGDAAAQSILILWDVHNEKVEPTFPIAEDGLYAETAIRGLGRILPGMRGYLERMPRPSVDGGYYTKTQENRPLAGPLSVPGAYVIGAASGYGIMAAAGLAELLAGHITGGQLPEYAPLFSLERYEDPGYQALLANWGESWQL
ncbi:MAG: FAD-binding oxidoreductase [Anaerolineales bacterium]|nr:FAD-binding oxidoreductase [Anaerolineales bacterium]